MKVEAKREMERGTRWPRPMVDGNGRMKWKMEINKRWIEIDRRECMSVAEA